MPQSADVVQSSECRQCCAFCDRVLLPSGCIESRCPYLYLYDDEKTGRRFMGCLNKVFKVEIDVELFREAERTRHEGVLRRRRRVRVRQPALLRRAGGRPGA